MFNLQQKFKFKWPKSVGIKVALIGIVGVIISGIFIIIAAIISRPSVSPNMINEDVIIQILDKNTYRNVSGALISINSMNVYGVTDTNGNFKFKLKSPINHRIKILITVPVDSLYLDSISKRNGKVYETIRVEPK